MDCGEMGFNEDKDLYKFLTKPSQDAYRTFFVWFGLSLSHLPSPPTLPSL